MSMKLSGMNQLVKNLEKMGRNVQKTKRSAILAGATVIRDEMEDNNPSDRFEIAIEEEKDGTIAVGPEKDFYTAHWFEYGTSPHLMEVRQKGKKGKKVMSDGEHIYGKKVEHPGQKPEPFVEPSFLNSQNRAILAMENDLKRSLT
ncbi:HK97-gp10 family putative phage morphogenesis protein [Priestia aryabhattai]|uniref:HK97-gp10 family putative phage morphogenesis protein n=1 Tax=Priestia aryabhattai TaxID=412384 RepID=UPI003CC37432